MPRKHRTPFGACKFRGFSPQDTQSNFIVFRHRKVHGLWVYGSYVFDQITGHHFIENPDGRFRVIADTVGLQDPKTNRWVGDTCYRQRVRGVVRFGCHQPTQDGRVEVHYYIQWLDDQPRTAQWDTNLVHWANQPKSEIAWAGTYWDPVSEYRHFL